MGLNHPRFQLTAWSTKYAEVKAVRTAVVAALNGFTNGASMSGVVVAQIIVENDMDLTDPQTFEFGASIDACIWHY